MLSEEVWFQQVNEASKVSVKGGFIIYPQSVENVSIGLYIVPNDVVT